MNGTPQNQRAGLCLLFALLLCPAVASAGLIDIQFKFSSTSGPQIFTDNIGSFQYDEAIIPIGGGKRNGNNLFTALSVSFGGFSWDESTANGGWLDFSPSGAFEEAFFGNNCSAGTCEIVAGEDHWWLRVGIPGATGIATNTFQYSGFSTNGEPNNATSKTDGVELITSVPEPGMLTLLVLGLCGILLSNRKHFQTTARPILQQHSIPANP